MNLNLPKNSSPSDARKWLRLLVREFGLGFHLDTPAADYIQDNGLQTFSASDCEKLDQSLEVLFDLLGENDPYEVCAAELYKLLRSSLKPQTKS